MALTHGDPVAAQAAIACLGVENGAADDAFRSSAGRGASLIGNVPASAAIARSWLAYLHGDVVQMTDSADKARARLRDDEELLTSTYRLGCALADWLGGRLDAAGQWFTAGIARWRASGQQALAAQGCNHAAQIRIAQGNLDGALDAYHELLQITAPPDRLPSPVGGIGRAGRAAVHYQRGDLTAARKDLTDGLPPCRQLSDRQPLAAGLATLAWILQAEGDPAGAREAMREAIEAGPSPVVASLLNPVPAERTRLFLAQGDVDVAAAWTMERGLRPDGEPSYASERDYLVLARVLLAQDLSRPALGLLTGCGPRRKARAAPGASSRSVRCGHWRSGAAAMSLPPRQSLPRRSPWPPRGGIFGCSPTRARRWSACWVGYWQRTGIRGRPSARCRPATWGPCCEPARPQDGPRAPPTAPRAAATRSLA